MATLELSTTSFGKFSLCPKKYEYYAVHKLVSPWDRYSLPMRRGIWLHASLQEYYAGKLRRWRSVLNRFPPWAEEKGLPAETVTQVMEECTSIMEEYERYYATHEDKLEGAKPLIVEEPRYLKVPQFDAVLRTTLDLVVEDRRGIWVVEHKSTSEFPPPSWMSVDPQTAIDLIVLTQGGHLQPDGIMFNYLLTKPPSVPRVLQNGSAFYANTAVTTSRAFEEGANALRDAAKNNPKLQDEAIEAYLEEKRKELVADGQWFRQNIVIRPVPLLVQTARDVMGVLASIRQCEERDHWPRAFHVHNCPRYCEYSDLCISEYVNGRPSKEQRETNFRIDDGEREGR